MTKAQGRSGASDNTSMLSDPGNLTFAQVTQKERKLFFHVNNVLYKRSDGILVNELTCSASLQTLSSTEHYKKQFPSAQKPYHPSL